ncbi:phosphatase PAP2 family protein [Alkalicoccus urumqiensis]|uniref:Phosphatidic acid phosphatase type 2/haloperoxidase domain-containing protein n=1 Tax=Alkalicoccus urumqiensis TaxID=1548213 RepID=A0A2P6MGL7_ALKUR|nr:phosphatase PAP2 family protein [Alkalicoccus urumqiensis]PRO65429.1 hypothetical protein C6I21_09730 [Alkalicoccus urumqiensis]
MAFMTYLRWTAGAFAAVALLVFLFIGWEVSDGGMTGLDRFVSQTVFQLQNPDLIGIMGVITELGSVWFLTLMTVLLLGFLLWKRRYLDSAAASIVMLGTALLTALMKQLYGRERPTTTEQYDATGFSYPSGHSSGAAAFYGLVLYFIWVSPWRPGTKVTASLVPLFTAAAVALSRVFLDVHYASDLAGGFAFGAAWMILCLLAADYFRNK